MFLEGNFSDYVESENENIDNNFDLSSPAS